MARRSHFSFNKRQREIKKREKQQKKQDRRLTKRGASSDEARSETPNDEAIQEVSESPPTDSEDSVADESPAVRFDDGKV